MEQSSKTEPSSKTDSADKEENVSRTPQEPDTIWDTGNKQWDAFKQKVKEIGSTIKRQTSKINQDINGFVLTPTKRSENKENMQPELATSKLTAHKSPSFAECKSTDPQALVKFLARHMNSHWFVRQLHRYKLGKSSSDASRVFQTTPHKASRVHETHEAQVAAVLHGRKTKDC
ncbi:uncharacterized protein LOC134856089 [Symsagittifera roscoffensis]|uniref:uncharacterized protein LOC134856089 n=1 Tax=Symsagittifera roscoffensis TaxID=84072 RepID=UPI00307BC2F6